MARRMQAALKINSGTCIQMPHRAVEQLCRGHWHDRKWHHHRGACSSRPARSGARSAACRRPGALRRGRPCGVADDLRQRGPRMVGVARRILFRQDLAEEAVHDAFIRIWRGEPGSIRGAAARAAGSMRWCATAHSASIRDEHRYETSDESVEKIRLRSHPVADAGDQRAAPLPRADRPPAATSWCWPMCTA